MIYIIGFLVLWFLSFLYLYAHVQIRFAPIAKKQWKSDLIMALAISPFFIITLFLIVTSDIPTKGIINFYRYGYYKLSFNKDKKQKVDPLQMYINLNS